MLGLVTGQREKKIKWFMTPKTFMRQFFLTKITYVRCMPLLMLQKMKTKTELALPHSFGSCIS